MYIGHEWRRFVAVGCNHSLYACRVAQDNVMAFVEDFAPHVKLDLGDVHDLAPFRSGASGTHDESVDIEADFQAGVAWLRRYQPTHRVKGNHDWRIDKLSTHPRSIIRQAAQSVVNAIADVDRENGTLVKPYHMRRGWWQFGDTLFGHGWMFNEQAIRDHAETFGKCVIAHLHTPGMALGRTLKHTPAWCVGTLADPDKLDYAQTRRSTLRWEHGMVYGEFSDTACYPKLLRAECCHGEPEDWGGCME